MANTSGPLGNVPLPPIAVVVNSFRALRSIDTVFPGLVTNENTCSPGKAFCGSPNWNVMLAAALILVLADCVNVTLCTVVAPRVLASTPVMAVPAGNCVTLVANRVPTPAPEELNEALVKNKKLPVYVAAVPDAVNVVVTPVLNPLVLLAVPFIMTLV